MYWNEKTKESKREVRDAKVRVQGGVGVRKKRAGEGNMKG